MKSFLHTAAAACLITRVWAGPYPPAAGLPGSDAIAANDSRFISWATNAVVTRGPTEIDYPESSLASFGSEADATGPADATPASPYSVVSLGDGGSATLQFAQPFSDAPGADLAVFENGFSAGFLELAHVEVSSDGVNFFRFPSVSLTPASANIGEGGSVNPTNVRNLAGKYLAGHGTPFDLAELRSVSPLLDVQRVTHIRVIDCVGTNDPAFANADSLGHIIIDPYPTPYFTGGFDLDAAGVFHHTSTTYTAWRNANAITTTDPSADSNNNGVPNIIEYITGTGRLTPSISNGTVTLSLTRLSYRADATLRVEASADLIHWTPLAQSIHGAAMVSLAPGAVVSETGSAAKQSTVTLPISSLKFFRLAAEP